MTPSRVTRQPVFRLLASVVIGVGVSSSLALRLAARQPSSPSDQLLLFVVPAICLTFLAYLLYPRLQPATEGATIRAHLTGIIIAALAAICASRALVSQPPGRVLMDLVGALVGFWLLLVPTLRAIDDAYAVGVHLRVLAAWAGGTAVAAIGIGWLSNAYASSLALGALFVLALFGFALLFQHGLGRVRGSPHLTLDTAVKSCVFGLVSLAVLGALLGSAEFPGAFPEHLLVPSGSQLVAWTPLALAALPWLALVVTRWPSSRAAPIFANSRVVAALNEILPGLLLAGLFFLLYFTLGIFLNQTRFDVDDIFFDADGFIWRYRLTTEHWQDFYWRAVHPLALPILRPLAVTLTAILHGDAVMSVTLLAAAGGAACVLLMWLIVRHVLGDSSAALLSAALLGASASHLLFGAMIETYIFLSAGALLFLLLLLRKDSPFGALVAVGLATAGLTITSLGQSALTLGVLRPRLRLALRYIVMVLALLVPLSLLADLAYPRAAPLFFLPSGYAAEQENIWAGSPSRGRAMLRSIFLYSVAAPEPVVVDGVIPFPQSRFYHAESGRLAEYETPLQTVTAAAWLILLLLAGASLVINRSSVDFRLLLALLLCIAFNALLLVRYGKEFFLYSANWSYALVLAAVVAWAKLMQSKWFQLGLLLFLGLLLLNNLGLFATLARVTSPSFQ